MTVVPMRKADVPGHGGGSSGPNVRACLICRHFGDVRVEWPAVGDGECRRLAPDPETKPGARPWPAVRMDDFCGEFIFDPGRLAGL